LAQLTDDCFAHGGALTRLDVALQDLLSRLTPVTDSEDLPLAACFGRALSTPLVARNAVPPSDNSAVDGYAVYHEDLARDAETRLKVVGRATAGHPFAGPQPRGTAVRILTGAVMPAGPDTVMMQEDCSLEGDVVVIRPGIKRGANRRLAGEDARAGEAVIPAGRVLNAADLALAAATGHGSLPVRKPLRVALVSTGDEVHEPGGPLPEGGIYDANRPLLAALLGSCGCIVRDLGIQPDRQDRIAKIFAEAAACHDAVVTSGGVSTGDEDHVKAAIEAAGGRLHFWRLAIKPGRPVALGQIGRVPFFGLPGNPVAAMLTFAFFARPLLQRLAGATPVMPRSFPVTAGFAYRKKADRREWVRVSLHEEAGGWWAEKYPVDGAGVITSLTRTDGLVELPEEMQRLEPGAPVRFYPYAALGL
jgi:molybdopterin molybdotransferase